MLIRKQQKVRPALAIYWMRSGSGFTCVLRKPFRAWATSADNQSSSFAPGALIHTEKPVFLAAGSATFRTKSPSTALYTFGRRIPLLLGTIFDSLYPPFVLLSQVAPCLLTLTMR